MRKKTPHAAQVVQTSLAQFARGTPPRRPVRTYGNRQQMQVFPRKGVNTNSRRRKNRMREKCVPLASPANGWKGGSAEQETRDEIEK